MPAEAETQMDPDEESPPGELAVEVSQLEFPEVQAGEESGEGGDRVAEEEGQGEQAGEKEVLVRKLRKLEYLRSHQRRL